MLQFMHLCLTFETCQRNSQSWYWNRLSLGESNLAEITTKKELATKICDEIWITLYVDKKKNRLSPGEPNLAAWQLGWPEYLAAARDVVVATIQVNVIGVIMYLQMNMTLKKHKKVSLLQLSR